MATRAPRGPPTKASVLQWDAQTNEPYIRLPHPYSDFIVTPTRPSDISDIMSIFNDPRVYQWLTFIPHPFTQEHATQWVLDMKRKSDSIMDGVSPILSLSQGHIMDGCPVHVLRKVLPDGRYAFVGNISFKRCRFWYVEDEKERSRLAYENETKPIGDPGIVWSLSVHLLPTHHSQGLMTTAARYLITEWMIPRAGAEIFLVDIFEANIGSMRMAVKVGFVLQETLLLTSDIPNRFHKRLCLLRWRDDGRIQYEGYWTNEDGIDEACGMKQ
ncbi:hypothetical protein ABKN59_007933 [Abortiporus biennis]